jgi:mono/diheme cytochrome c family protein
MNRAGLRSGVASSAALFVLGAASGAPAAESNAVYDATCGLCHQARAAGLKGQFPRLAGRVDRMAASPEARVYLIQTVLHGLAGKIEIDGAALVGVMPPFESQPDAAVASVLNYLIGLGGVEAKKVKRITAAEVAAVRASPRLTGPQLLERRRALVAAGQVP